MSMPMTPMGILVSMVATMSAESTPFPSDALVLGPLFRVAMAAFGMLAPSRVTETGNSIFLGPSFFASSSGRSGMSSLLEQAAMESKTARADTFIIYIYARIT